jgi:hypothetical protein
MEGETILEWDSKEHHFDKKSADWYWILGIVCIGIAILAFYFDNIFFGILIIVAGFTIGILSYKETKIVKIKITTKGVIFGRELHPYINYRSFWIEDEHLHGQRILLRSIKPLMPLTVVPINELADLNEVRETLLDFLEEEPLQESILHRLFDQILAR